MHVVLGILTAVGVLLAWIALAVWAQFGTSVTTLVFLACGLALSVWPARALWRQDSYGAAKLLLFCLALPVLGSASWAFDSGSATHWTVLAVCWVPALACGAHLS